jgi:hypothetical protein
VHEVLQERQPVSHCADPGRELAVVHDRLEVGVVEEVPELLLHVAVVDVDGHGARLVRAERGLDPLDAVEPVDADVVARPDALRQQVVGEPVGPLLQLAVRAALVADHQDLSIGHRVHGVLEEVRDVVRHEI